jgi:TolB-like protein
MSDVFISYARSTAKQAQAAATALRNLGYSVWLDDELLAHRTYARVIEEQLAAAKAALVIWSADAVNSEWVLSEANRAREGEKLVQVVIERVRLPMPFDQIQCAELTGWTGNIEAPGWRKVAASIAELTAAAGGRRATPASTAARQAEPRVAVLAFDNLSGDPDLVYFSDGVSEEIQQTVVRTTSLKVIGRGSSFQFRGADKAAAHVGGALNATHVLDGSVRRSGQKVRIGAQLIECATETTLWSDRFDRDLSDIFAVQDEIAAAVAAALEIAFAPPAAPRSVDPAAYDLYLRARTTGSHAAAIELFEQAITLEPNFAQAWALLAGVRAMRLRYEARDAPYEVARAEVVHAAETALRLDPAAGAAYQALSWLEPFGCYQAREALGARALAVAPNDPVVLNRAGFFSAEVGRIGEALEYARRAHELDPLSPSAANNYACSLEAQGQYDKACELWDMICARWPDSEGLVGNAIGGAGVEGDWARIDKIVSNLMSGDFLQKRSATKSATAEEWLIKIRNIGMTSWSGPAMNLLGRARCRFPAWRPFTGSDSPRRPSTWWRPLRSPSCSILNGCGRPAEPQAYRSYSTTVVANG